MIYTNKLNLPKQFIPEESDRVPVKDVYSVTELLNSTREILLTREHYKDITIDISDTIIALFGTAVHNLMEQKKPDNCEAEFKIEYDFKYKNKTIKVKGRCDLVNFLELIIEDYKTCSTSKIIKEDFDDWKKQGLLYALIIYFSLNIKIKKLKFYALMKDWSKIKSATNSSYPSSPIYVWEYDIEDSDLMYINEWLYRKFEELETPGCPECTDEERWYTGTKYAVYKSKSDKKATIICDTEEEAHGYITNKCGGAGRIDVRKGENLKCKYYCGCRKFCKRSEQI
jgi:hypothetical protein